MKVKEDQLLVVFGASGDLTSRKLMPALYEIYRQQLVSLVAMEPPTQISTDAIRNETLKVLQSIRPFTSEEITSHVIRGQYTTSTVRGIHCNAYRDEPDSERYPAAYIHQWTGSDWLLDKEAAQYLKIQCRDKYQKG